MAFYLQNNHTIEDRLSNEEKESFKKKMLKIWINKNRG